MDDTTRALRLRNRFLFVGHGLDHLVMLIYATAVLGLSKELHLSFGELLPLSLGGFIAFGCCSLPAGWLADRWSRHGMMLVFFFGTGLCTIGAGFAHGPVQIAIALTAIGVFAGIYHPVASALLVSDQQRMGRMLAVSGLFGNMGVALAALVTGALTDLVSWRAAFIVPGAITLLLGFAYARFVPATISRPQGARLAARAAQTLDRATMVRVFAILALSTAIGGLLFASVTVSLPKMFDERLAGLVDTSFGIGAVVCVVYAIAAVGQMAVGPLIDRFSMRAVFIPVVALQVPFLVFAGLGQGWAVIVAAVLMILMIFAQVPVNDTMVGRYTTETYRSRVFALRYLLSFAVSAAAVPFVALVHDATGGFGEIYFVLAGLSAAMLVSALWFPSARRFKALQETAPVGVPAE